MILKQTEIEVDASATCKRLREQEQIFNIIIKGRMERKLSVNIVARGKKSLVGGKNCNVLIVQKGNLETLRGFILLLCCASLYIYK